MAETGHAKNVANFEEMISFCVGYGGGYKPTNAVIELAGLQAALAGAQGAIDDVTTGIVEWKVKVNGRENEYAGVGKLATRVVSSYAASGVTANAVEDMQGFARKIAGARKNKIEVDDPNTPENEAAHNSVSQRSYSNVAEHFDAMIEMAKSEPLYAPNEADLAVVALEAKSAAMKAANLQVTDKVTALSNDRITRNDVLYGETDGICELARLVKLYVKSAFGATSPQYKQISGLEFTKPRTR